MTKQEAIDQAIDRIKGRELPIGTTVAIKTEELTHELLRYEGDFAIVELQGETKSWPKSEVFSPKQVINVANHLLNLGFWTEGVESMIISL